MPVDFRAGSLFQLNTRTRSSNCVVSVFVGGMSNGVGDFLSGFGDIASSKLTAPSRRVSSTDNPEVKSVRNPRSNPRNPPRAWKAANDLGFNILFSCPGVKANLLSSTWKSCSSRGSGFKASDTGTSSYLAGSCVASWVASEFALDRPTVSEQELNESDLDRRVSPSSDCDVRGGAFWTVSRAVSGDSDDCEGCGE